MNFIILKRLASICKKNLNFLFLLLGVFSFLESIAQYQPMFTQYMFNEMVINPAYTGARECLSTTLLYRNQWTGLEGAPVTQTFNLHSPIANQKMGIGFTVINDKITVINNTSISANYSYRIALGKGKLSFGIQGGFINHFEKLSELSPGQNNDPQFAANTPKVTLPSAGAGIFYYTKKMYAGISVPQIISSNVAPGDLKKNKQ